MNPVEDYIYSKPEPIKDIMIHVHMMSKKIEGVDVAIKWSLPMYMFGKKHLWYMNPLKTGGLELVFIRSDLFTPEDQALLQKKSRKRMYGMTIRDIEDLDESLISHLFKSSLATIEQK